MAVQFTSRWFLRARNFLFFNPLIISALLLLLFLSSFMVPYVHRHHKAY